MVEYGRTRSQTKKAKEAAGEGTALPPASPARLAGAFDDEADSAAGAAAAARRTLRQRQPRLTQAADNNNVNRNASAASGTPGRSASVLPPSAQKKTPRTPAASTKRRSARPRRNTEEEETETETAVVPASAQTTRAPYYDRKNLNFPNSTHWAYALCDTDVNWRTFADAHKYDGSRHGSMIDGIEKNTNAMKREREAWANLQTMQSVLALAEVRVRADLQAKAGTVLTRAEQHVARLLWEKDMAAATAGAATGAGAGAGAGGIPAGGGAAAAGAAAAAGGYGHGYGHGYEYAGGIGVGIGAGAGAGAGNAGVVGYGAGGPAQFQQYAPGPGMRGGGVPFGQLAEMHGAGDDAIGGAPNFIPPSPAAAAAGLGAAGAGGGIGKGDGDEEVSFNDAEIRFLLDYNAQQMAQLRREHDDDKNQQLAGAAKTTEVQEKMLQQMQRMESDAQRNQNQQNEVNANLLGEIKRTQQMHLEYQANHAAYHEEEGKKRDAKHNELVGQQNELAGQQNELAGRTTNLEGQVGGLHLQVGGLEKMFKEKFGIGENGGEDAGATDSTAATKTPATGSSVAPATLKNTPVATADVCVGTVEETNDDDSKMPPSDLSGTNIPSNQATKSAAGGAVGDSDTLVVGSISYADTCAAPLPELEKWLKERSMADGNRIHSIVIRRILKDYVHDEGINSTMRQGAPSIQQQNLARSLSVALIALKPYPFRDHWVYRGIKSKTREFVLNFKDLMERGEPFVEPGLLSACALSFDTKGNMNTEGKKKTNKFYCRNTHIAIRSKSGRLIKNFSQQPDEWEVLFAAGTSFRILSFEDTTPGVEHDKSDDGRYKIVMEEISSQIWGL